MIARGGNGSPGWKSEWTSGRRNGGNHCKREEWSFIYVSCICEVLL